MDNMLLGNTADRWIAGLAIAAGLYLLLFLLKKLICYWLSGRAEKTKIILDDLFLAMVRKTKPFFFAAAGLYGGSMFVFLSRTARHIVGKVTATAMLVQIGICGTASLTVWFEKQLEKGGGGPEDGSRAATMKILNYFVRGALWILVLLLVLDNLGVKITTLVAGLGIGGVAVALAVQNVLGDILAFFSIIMDKPFVIGDYIEIDAFEGTVEHVGLKTTRVRSLYGEQLVFSNTDLLKGRIKNYRRMSERRAVLTLDVPRETPYEKLAGIPKMAEEIIGRQEKARFDRAHLSKIRESAFSYEIIYWVTSPVYRDFMDVQQAVDLGLIKKLRDEGIGLAVPTQRVVLDGGTANTVACPDAGPEGPQVRR